MLRNISSTCGTSRDAIKVPTLHALMDVAPEEGKGRVAWDLSAALCRQGSFEQGIKLYEQTIASRINEPSLNQALQIARMQAGSQNSGSAPVMGTLPNGSGGQSSVLLSHLPIYRLP